MKISQNMFMGLLLLSTLSIAAKFDISSVSTCTQQS